MRSNSFARVVMAGLAVSVIITLGCHEPPTRPSGPLSISPADGPSSMAAVVTIFGIGFQSGASVTVDGSRVDATVLNANTISVVMPPHAAGKVDVAVSRAPNQAPSVMQGGYTYVGPPIVSDVVPNIGSTGGGAPIFIKGDGFWNGGVTVTVGGLKTPLDDLDNNTLYLTTPAHAAGPVDVIVTDKYGQSGSAIFTYASPATFDLNGDWKGWATGQLGQSGMPVVLTIRDNIVIGVSCGSAPSVTLDPAPVVANGGFSFADGGVSITGKILSPIHASGTINMASCGNRTWSAEKK